MINWNLLRQLGCGDISIGGQYDCTNPLQGGTRPRVILINKDDIASVSYSSSTPGLITGITLLSGKSAYAFEGFKNSNTPSVEKISAASGQALWKHMVNYFVYENTQLQKNNIEKKGNGKFVVIIQNSKADNNAFEVYGLGNGLEMADGAINNKNENNGAYNIILSSGEGQGEAKLPQTWFITDLATTLSAVNALLFAPTITNVSPTTVAAAGGTSVTITGTLFYGSGATPDVSSVKWINQSTLAETNQASFTVASTTSITLTSVALTAGVYKVRVTTSKGVAESTINVTSA